VNGGGVTTLASFSPPLVTGVVLGNGTLYGTTLTGGASNNAGSVFSVPVNGGAVTTLASFAYPAAASPYSRLTLVGDTLYGTTTYGGSNNYGTVFSIPVTGGAPTVLATFSPATGDYPTYSGVTLVGNNLYGTTGMGGAYGDGTIYSIPVTGGVPTVLASFNGANGNRPWTNLTLSGGTLFGTTVLGGAYNHGTVFALSGLNILPASISLGNTLNATIVKSGTGTLGTTVSNSAAPGASNLNYNLTAAVTSGSASLGALAPAAGTLAPSASQSSTISAASNAVGVNTISFTASDPNSSNGTAMTAATLTVLDRAAAAFAGGAGARSGTGRTAFSTRSRTCLPRTAPAWTWTP
jgi:uncharacterized repeat protein (TIGR03803 family)